MQRQTAEYQEVGADLLVQVGEPLPETPHLNHVGRLPEFREDRLVQYVVSLFLIEDQIS